MFLLSDARGILCRNREEFLGSRRDQNPALHVLEKNKQKRGGGNKAAEM